MGKTKIMIPTGIHRVRKRLADGTARVYYYAWRGGPRIKAQPGTEAFLLEWAAHVEQARKPEQATIDMLMAEYRASQEWAALAHSTRRDHEYAFRLIAADFPRLPLKFTQERGTHLHIQQGKTGSKVKVLVHPQLRLVIESLPKCAVTVLTNSRSKPWTSLGFQASWRKALAKAGIEGLTFHDLRGTFITERAREGATPIQIAAISGHSISSVNQVLREHYLADDQQAGDAVILRMGK